MDVWMWRGESSLVVVVWRWDEIPQRLPSYIGIPLRDCLTHPCIQQHINPCSRNAHNHKVLNHIQSQNTQLHTITM